MSALPLQARYDQAACNSIGSLCQFIVFPGAKHQWPAWSFLKEFFERNLTKPFPPPLPKPLNCRLYFPHVASFDQWETEIALTNTSEGPIRGKLRPTRRREVTRSRLSPSLFRIANADAAAAAVAETEAGSQLLADSGRKFRTPSDMPRNSWDFRHSGGHGCTLETACLFNAPASSARIQRQRRDLLER